MAVTISTNLTNVLDPAMVEAFMDGAISTAVDYQAWMRVRPASDKTISKAAVNPPSQYGSHVEGAEFSYAEVVEGNPKTYTLTEVALAFQVSAYSMGFIDRATLLEFVRQIGAASARKLNADAYAVLSGGFSDTGPDGVSLFNTAHTAQTGGNQSNTGTTALSEASLQAALIQQRRMKTPDNILAGNMPNLLVVPPDLEFTAKELVGSALSGADMQNNVLREKGLTVLVTPEFSDASDWFLLDTVQFPAYQYINKGSAPQQFIDPDSQNWKVNDRMVYTQGYDAWRGAFGAQVA